MSLGVRNYMGEFFLMPSALHANLPRCGYNCAYCFVNEFARAGGYKEDTDTSIPKTKQAWKEHLRTRRGILGEFIKQKKLVVLSNTSDFFSPGVFTESLPLVEAMMEEGLPMLYQTRGGPQAEAWARSAPKASWAISITSDDKKLTGEAESITPQPAARRKLAETLIGLGHSVFIEVNPFIASWWKDIPAFIRWAESAGVSGLGLQCLHLSRIYKTKLDADTLRRVTPLLPEGNKSSKERHKMYAVMESAFACSLPLFDGYATDCEYARRLKAPYSESSLIPTMFEFFDKFKIGAEVTIDDFVEFFAPRLPDVIDRKAEDYVRMCARARAGFRATDEKRYRIRNFREALEVLWNNPWEIFPKFWGSQHMAVRGEETLDGKIDYAFDDNHNIVGVRTLCHQPMFFIPGVDDAGRSTTLEEAAVR